MKVTFGVHVHDEGVISLVHSTVKGNSPSYEEWERAAESAKKTLDEQSGRRLYGDDSADHRWVTNYSISFVMKGWVDFEERAPRDLG